MTPLARCVGLSEIAPVLRVVLLEFERFLIFRERLRNRPRLQMMPSEKMRRAAVLPR